MTDIKRILKNKEYDFLRNDKNLGKNIILLGFGGSYAYGTNNETSDIDIRGIAVNNKRNILTGNDFEQVVDNETDTTIYSFNKIIKLLCNCNPNTIEMLGLKPEHYFFLNDIGKELIKNRSMFLSKKAIYSFGGYANSQLRRLENKSVRSASQSKQEEHILKSIEHASFDFKERYAKTKDDAVLLYIDKSQRENLQTEIFCDIELKHYPLRDFKDLISDMNAIIKSYENIGRRNERALEHNKLSKHMMHLVRLYLMAFDILEKGEIITYREKEHDFLMKIRKGYYLNENQQPTKEFYEIIDEYENKLDKLKETTDLPETVDMKKVMDFVAAVNKKIVLSN